MLADDLIASLKNRLQSHRVPAENFVVRRTCGVNKDNVQAKAEQSNINITVLGSYSKDETEFYPTYYVNDKDRN